MLLVIISGLRIWYAYCPNLDSASPSRAVDVRRRPRNYDRRANSCLGNSCIRIRMQSWQSHALHRRQALLGFPRRAIGPSGSAKHAFPLLRLSGRIVHVTFLDTSGTSAAQGGAGTADRSCQLALAPLCLNCASPVTPVSPQSHKSPCTSAGRQRRGRRG